MFCLIRYHWYNLKNVKNTHGGMLLLVKLQALKPATLQKVTLFHGYFSRFLNCTNGTKSRNASHITSCEVYYMNIRIKHRNRILTNTKSVCLEKREIYTYSS